jgi:hypothetical protein
MHAAPLRDRCRAGCLKPLDLRFSGVTPTVPLRAARRVGAAGPAQAITTDLDCHRCGAEGEHHRRGLCTRCTLRDDLTAPAAPPGRAPEPMLTRLVDVLVNVDGSESIHTWKRNPKVGLLLQNLASGDITLMEQFANWHHLHGIRHSARGPPAGPSAGVPSAL